MYDVFSVDSLLQSVCGRVDSTYDRSLYPLVIFDLPVSQPFKPLPIYKVKIVISDNTKFRKYNAHSSKRPLPAAA